MISQRITRLLLMVFAALCFFMSGPLWAVITVDVIGQLPRATENLGQISFQVAVRGTKVRQAAEQDRWLRLDLRIKGGKRLGYTNTPTSED
nr:hypothetical protein [Oligoflexales bacterium]